MTSIQGVGTGSAPVVDLTFPFLDKTHIKAVVNTVPVALKWTGATRVEFVEPVASGADWVVYRDTPVELPFVDFQDGTVLTARDLDTAYEQLRFHQMEVDERLALNLPSPAGILRSELKAADGADLVGYQAAWGAYVRTQADKNADLPHLYDLIAPANRVPTYDATAALQAALDTGKQFVLPDAEVQFSGTLNVTKNGSGFIGQGHNSKLVHTSPTADMFLVGDGTNEISGLRFVNFRLWSTVTKTAGAAFNCRFLSDTTFERVYVGSLDDYVAAGNVNRLWNGYIFNRFAEITLWGGQALVQNELVQMHGNLDQSFGYEIMFDGNWRGLFAAVGIRQGGGTGGVYYNRADLSQCGMGVSIDQTLTAAMNREAFFSSDFTVDSCTGAGVVIDQASIGAGQFIFDRTWLASNGTHGLWIKNANDVRVIAAVHAYKNGGDGIRYDDANCYLVVPPEARFDINTGYGVNPTVASSRLEISDATFLANTAGKFNTTSNTVVTKRLGGSQFDVSPLSVWENDYANNTTTVANGANAALAAGSGMVIVSNPANGHTAAYLVSGASVVLLGTTGASWVAPTTTPGAGTASIAWDGVSAYRLYNNYGSSQTFAVALTAKTRPTV